MFGPHKQSWPTERVDRLGALLAAGYSASQAAREMGCTRNSIIGIAHRKKLPFKFQSTPGRPKATGPRSAAPRRSTPFRPPAWHLPNYDNRPSVAEANPPVHLPVTSLLDLRDYHCRWPHGDVGSPDFYFCGGPPIEGYPYCPHHCRLAYRRPGQREEQAA